MVIVTVVGKTVVVVLGKVLKTVAADGTEVSVVLEHIQNPTTVPPAWVVEVW